jgi:hypothetical protein
VPLFAKPDGYTLLFGYGDNRDHKLFLKNMQDSHEIYGQLIKALNLKPE